MPLEPALKKIAQANGIEGNGIEDLVHNKKLNDIVLKDLQTTGRQGGLTGIEIIEAVVLADEEWTPASVSDRQLERREGYSYSCPGVCDCIAEAESKSHLKPVPKECGQGIRGHELDPAVLGQCDICLSLHFFPWLSNSCSI